MSELPIDNGIVNGQARSLNRAQLRHIRDEQARRVWRLRTQGLLFEDIAAELELPLETVRRMFHKKNAEVQERFLQRGAEVKAEAIGRLDLIYAESMAAWHRSQQDAEEIHTGLAALNQRTGEVVDLPDKVVRRGQVGNVAFLAQAESATIKMLKVGGLDEPDKHEVSIAEDAAHDTLMKKLQDLKNRALAEKARVDEITVVGEDVTPRTELENVVQAERDQKALMAAERPKSLLNTLLPSQRAETADGVDLGDV